MIKNKLRETGTNSVTPMVLNQSHCVQPVLECYQSLRFMPKITLSHKPSPPRYAPTKKDLWVVKRLYSSFSQYSIV